MKGLCKNSAAMCVSIALFCALLESAGCNDGRDNEPATYPVDHIVKSDTMVVSGTKVLFLKGTHEERGYSHGLLMGMQIKDVFDGFIVRDACKNDDSTYNQTRAYMARHYDFETKYRTEAAAMVRGMRDSRTGLYSSVLGRDIDSFDLLVLSSAEELQGRIQFGCTSWSSWGVCTLNDPVLRGELVITRHWDYVRFEALVRNLCLIVHCPTEPDEQDWVSCTWPGVIGTCSGMNVKGIGAFMNYAGGYYRLDSLSRARPISFSLRNAVELRDLNHDGINSTMDVVDAIRGSLSNFSTAIHAVSPASVRPCALVIEYCSQTNKVALRDQSCNTTPPVIHGDNLIATNHYRELAPPVECPRYSKFADSLSASTAVSVERNWDMMSAVAGVSLTLYRLQFIPSTGTLRYAIATPEKSAIETPPISLSFHDLLRFD